MCSTSLIPQQTGLTQSPLKETTGDPTFSPVSSSDSESDEENGIPPELPSLFVCSPDSDVGDTSPLSPFEEICNYSDLIMQTGL